MKGISPLVATALLIAITISVAVILANFVSTYTRQTLSSLPTCVGGALNYVSADYPKWDDTADKVTAVVEAQSVSLGNFTFEVLLTNDTLISAADSQGLALRSGSTGTVISNAIAGLSKADIKQIRIGTNCSNVKTEWSVPI